MGKGTDSILNLKSYAFAIRIVKLSQFLRKEKSEYVLSKQILRSGTAIGALIRESEFGQSKPDFIHKLSLALKEANETDYWISLLYDTEYIDKIEYTSLQVDCNELISLLVASIKTLKSNLNF
ncbi:four helix bundle protein [Dysgonomonas hofstadii]|uniref:Four helix bundle protein n=1 Tax=Dysgonomonas hofstadii TaxID=637886 RepID=A0A840CPV4_9BACT|nr:four helix bundle protein [Dysgonomonas hofstadii]MBB4034985.1 four helix bundle protein [Dysgonomonas hofstadii]